MRTERIQQIATQIQRSYKGTTWRECLRRAQPLLEHEKFHTMHPSLDGHAQLDCEMDEMIREDVAWV